MKAVSTNFHFFILPIFLLGTIHCSTAPEGAVPEKPVKKTKYCEKPYNGLVGRAHTSTIFRQNPIFFIENESDLFGFYVQHFDSAAECLTSNKFKNLPVVEWVLKANEEKNKHLQYSFEWMGKDLDVPVKIQKFRKGPENSKHEQPGMSTMARKNRYDFFSQFSPAIANKISQLRKNIVNWLRKKSVRVSIMPDNENGPLAYHCTLLTYLDNSGNDTSVKLYACPEGVCHENTLFFFDKDFWGTKQTILNVLKSSAENNKIWQTLWTEANARCNFGLLPILKVNGINSSGQRQTLKQIMESA